MPAWDRLSALDSAFLDLETTEAPLHVGWTIRVDGRPPSLAALRRHLDARLERVPRFRRRVLHPLLGDAHWADDRPSTSPATSTRWRCPRPAVRVSCASSPASCSPTRSTTT